MIVKAESIPGRAFTTQVEATLALFEYIDGFYNSRRIQKRLGYLSPIEFEEKHYADPATAERTNLKPHHPALTSSSALPHAGGTSNWTALTPEPGPVAMPRTPLPGIAPHTSPGAPSLSGPGNGSDSRLTADSLLAAHPCNQLRLSH